MYEIKMPKFGLTMEKGYIERWLKKEGEPVNKGDSILEVSSDKISNEISSPVSGILLKIIGNEGEEYPVGQVIAVIGEKDEQYRFDELSERIDKEESVNKQSQSKESIKKTVNITGKRKIKASPIAKKMAKNYGLELSQITGSGPGNRIIKQDILSFLKRQNKGDFTIKKLSGLRKTIIERLTTSFHNAVTLTNTTEVDFTQLKRQSKLLGVGITPAIIFLLCKVLVNQKQFNAHFEKDSLKEYNVVNIGLAVDTEKGLMVPVLRNAHTLDINSIQEKIKDLSDRARTNSLIDNEFKQSTFTVTNLGMMRTDFFTPVLNPPEVAILGIGRILKKPCVFDEDKITIRDMAYLSLSYDHRVIDGADAARFLEMLALTIENPELLKTEGVNNQHKKNR